MQAILSGDAEPLQLRSGIQPAVAASASDADLAAGMELVSILDGASFRGSTRSCAFLRFVVEETLAGRQETLKERTIGAAVLGKPFDYDTGADSAVRVRANEVRKRLAAHYAVSAPKAGIRIELPLGTYSPRFVANTLASPLPVPARRDPQPPRMLLWQLAAPTLIAVFLSLIAIRAGVESSDSFSRFWNQAIAGRTEITVVVDSGAGASISPLMADAAMPLERLAGMLQVPVHIVAAGGKPGPEACVIRLSLTGKPDRGEAFHLGGAVMFRGGPDAPAVWLWAQTPDALRAATQTLTSPSGFPEIDFSTLDLAGNSGRH
jgi:hypothetical protein